MIDRADGEVLGQIRPMDEVPWSSAGAIASDPIGPAPVGRREPWRRRSGDNRLSYPPVASVQRALDLLRLLNQFRIANLRALHGATGLPKPTIVRLLETLMAEGYVARDPMAGGYRVTGRARDLAVGYAGASMVIEAARARLIELTRCQKWPVALGVGDRDGLSIQFWTGALSPFPATPLALGSRPSPHGAMALAYATACPDSDREKLVRQALRALTPAAASAYREALARAGERGLAESDAVEPRGMSSIAMPIRLRGCAIAAIAVSFHRSAIGQARLDAAIVAPLQAAAAAIERNLALLAEDGADLHQPAGSP